MLLVPELYCQGTVMSAPRLSGTVCVAHRGLNKGMGGSTDFMTVVPVDAESVVRYIVNE